jgi:uncharacterized protein (DUF924 family)
MATMQQVIDFWFKELKPDDWFAASDALDADIRSRQVQRGEPGR